MTEQAPGTGSIGWVDLTVGDATRIRDFYASVAGWRPEAVEMGEYADFNMLTSDGTAAAGVCHARGENAYIPPVWLVYITVQDLDASIERVRARGGETIGPVREAESPGRYQVIRDPAGAICALWQGS